MDHHTQQTLINLNHQFYQSFAEQFSGTRRRLQPGVARMIEKLPDKINLLDLGCGNGELACSLLRGGHRGRYVGVDSSRELLAIAAETAAACHVTGTDLQVDFTHVDLTAANWSERIPVPFVEQVYAFAVLHHLPGQELRRRVLDQVRQLMSPGGSFIHSGWQFLNSDRLRQRIKPWEEISLSAEKVEAGDYLLDWRQGGTGLRYVHHFNQAELLDLAETTGFRIVETFSSDGKEGNLGLYQVWESV